MCGRARASRGASRRQTAATKSRGSSATPGGLAARYFNRTAADVTAFLKVITTGRIATIRKLPGKKIPAVFDLSERAIVPIVSRVKTDPARKRVGPVVQEANRTVNRLGSRCELGSSGIVPGSRSRFVRSGRLFGRCRSAGRMCCMDHARNVYRRAGWLARSGILRCLRMPDGRTPEEKIANSNIPREFQKVSMPDYVVEPPDLMIVEVLEALPGRPISGERLVRPDGKISLGFYGDVYVAGLTMPEVKEKIVLHLRKYLTDEVLGLIEIDERPASSKIDPEDRRAEADRAQGLATGLRRRHGLQQQELLRPGRCR